MHGLRSFILLRMREEVIDGRHDLRWPASEELPEAMFGILMSLFFVFEHRHSPVSFVHSAKQSSSYK